MADIARQNNQSLATTLFRRQTLVFLITLVCSLIIFILSVRIIFQTMWDQAIQAVRMEIEREADTIARLLVFEFSHLTDLETQANSGSEVDERVKRLIWEKVTFNETIRGIELINRQSDSQGQHLTYSFFPLSHLESESEQGPQKSLKSFSGLEGDLIRIINGEQRVDRNLLDSINQGRKLEGEMLWRYLPLYIPLPDQGAVYWGVAKVGINVDARRRFQIILEDEKSALRRTLGFIMGGVIVLALTMGLLGFRWMSKKTAAPLGNYAILDSTVTSGPGIDIESLLSHLQHQDSQDILEFDQIQNFCLRLGGTIKSLGERLIEAERQACAGRLAARLVQAGLVQGEPGSILRDWTGLFTPLPEEWQEVDLIPIFELVRNYLKAVLPKETTLIEEWQPIAPIYGSGANLVQAVWSIVDFALSEMQPQGEFSWHVAPLETGGFKTDLSFGGRNFGQEDISRLLQPFKAGTGTLPPLGIFLASAIARQHGGILLLEANPSGGLSLHLGIPDARTADAGQGEKSAKS